MKTVKLSLVYSLFLLFLTLSPFQAGADTSVSQDIELSSGWNIISTPMIVESHTFSVLETSDNFDIYVLDASKPTGWATMADLGQTEFAPLYGYFVNNKTGQTQTLTLHYKDTLSPSEKLFEREFSTPGWYSVGVANDEYAKNQAADTSDTNNPSRILSLLAGDYDLVIDFTDAVYSQNRRSVAVGDPWKAVVPQDIDSLNDLRETKGYAVYIKETGARYNGFQNDPVVSTATDQEEELIVMTSTSDLDATTLHVEDDVKSDFMTVFVFSLGSGDSDDNIEILSVPVQVTLSGASYAQIIDDAELVIGDVIYDDFIVSDTESSDPTLTFSIANGAVLYPGEKLDATLNLRFKALALSNEGVTVSAAVNNVDTIVAQSVEVLTVDQISGSATGDVHTLRTAGIDVVVDQVDADVTSADGAVNDYAVYRISLEITAFEQDVYISTDPSVSISHILETSSGVPVTDGLSTIALTSTSDEEGSYFVINEGETEILTITVTYAPGVAGTSARLQLEAIEFSTTAAAPSQIWTAVPDTDYRTAVVTIVN